MAGAYRAEVLSHRQVAVDHWELVLKKDGALHSAEPGQFVNVAVRGREAFDPLLRRPFSFFRESETSISLLYRVVGRGTRRLASVREGEELDLVGPLGRGFEYRSLDGPALLVGGGVGVPPLFHLSQRLVAQGREHTALVGFSNEAYALGLSEWRELGVEVRVATDDGSLGKAGLVTRLLEERLKEAPVRRIFACGPRPMLQAVAAIAGRFGVPSQVAMEEWMGCGLGVCLSCVVKVKPGGGEVRWARVCMEGPVFSGDEVVWSRA